MSSGVDAAVVVAVFIAAAVLVTFWREVLAVLAVFVLGLLLLGAVQLVHLVQGLT